MEGFKEGAQKYEESLEEINQNIYYRVNQKGIAVWKIRFFLMSSTIGPIIVVLPQLFQECGILKSFILLAIAGIILWISCLWIVQKSANSSQIDLVDIITDNLGPKWTKLYDLMRCLLLVQVGIMHFILSCEFIYPIIQFVGGENAVAPREQFTFSTVSYQQTGLILTLLLMIAFQKEDMKIFMKLSRLKILSLFLLSALCISNILENLPFNELKMGKDKSSKGIIILIGTLLMQFQAHTISVPILKASVKKQPKRDVTISFVFSFFILALLNVPGSIVIQNNRAITSSPHTILDYFSSSDIFANIVRIFMFISTASFGIIIFRAFRDKALDQIDLIFPNWVDRHENKLMILFSIIIPIIAFLHQLFEVDLSIFASVTGYALCSLISIILPFCLFMSQSKLEQKIYHQESELKRISTTLTTNSHEKETLSVMNGTYQTDADIKDGGENQLSQSRNHHPDINSIKREIIQDPNHFVTTDNFSQNIKSNEIPTKSSNQNIRSKKRNTKPSQKNEKEDLIVTFPGKQNTVLEL